MNLFIKAFFHGLSDLSSKIVFEESGRVSQVIVAAITRPLIKTKSVHTP
jgi:hypothetical protein